MNKSIRKVAVALAVLFIALFVNLNFVQVVKRNSYRDHADNARVVLNEHSSPRGDIIVDGVAVAHSDERSNGSARYLRVYDNGPLWSPVTGFYSLDASTSNFLGTSGIEEADNAVLSGDDPKLFSTRLTDLLTGRDPRGGSIELTLDRSAQSKAYSALDTQVNGLPLRGSVVALDPTTGAILAAVSAPSYDPNLFSPDDGTLVAHRYACVSNIDFPLQGTDESDRAYATRSAQSVRVQLALRTGGTTELTSDNESDPTQYPLSSVVYTDDGRGAQTSATLRYTQQFPRFGAKGCSDLPDGQNPTALFRSDPHADGPLLNRAFNQLYPPGSIFKTVVASTALEAGVTPGTSLIAPVSYYPADGRTATTPCRTGDVSCVENFEGEQCQPGSTTATLAFAFAKSCNTLFSAVAIEKDLGVRIGAKARQFGFGTQLSVPLPVATSTVGSRADLTESGFLARTAFGQQNVRVTTLQAAMMAAAPADDGKLMKPYLVNRELAANLDEISKTEPTQLSQVLDPDVDQDLKSMMEGVVKTGTGQAAAITNISGVVVGGKTGTADTGRKLANGQDEPPDSWFIGYASQNGSPKIAIAVIVEKGGNSADETTGGANAAPIAQAVMEAYLQAHQ